jgi:hypothetical protein
MFQHTDTDYLVIPALNRGKVGTGNLNVEVRLACPLRREFSMSQTVGYTMTGRTPAVGQVRYQSAVATSNIQNYIVRRQLKLRRDSVKFLNLHLIERVTGGLRIAARVRHRLIEKGPVNVIANIVVASDIALSPANRIKQAKSQRQYDDPERAFKVPVHLSAQ